jgi:hypothetical protein
MHTSTLSPALQGTGPFATVLTDVSQDTESGRHEHELRIRAASQQLAEQGAPAEVVDAVAARLNETVHLPAPQARIVVATPEGVAYDDVALTRIDQPVATWSPLPDLAAWVTHRDATLPFVLALVDHEGGDISLWDSDVPEPETETSAGGELLYVHKVPTGGWAAINYQHSSENVWHHNADAVAAEITKLVRAHGHPLVLLGGDPASVSMVRKDLAELPATVVELEHAQRASDGGDETIAQGIREALLGEVVRRRTELTHRLREALGRGEGAATGVRDVAEAFVRGQVETLLLDPTALAEHELDPSTVPGLAFGAAQPSGPVRADLALVAAAVLTDADVSTLPRAALGGAPVAALLRWSQTG